MARYRVLSDDNFHSGVKDDRSEHGIYETAADAIKACQTIVDDSLLWEYQQCATPEGGPPRTIEDRQMAVAPLGRGSVARAVRRRA